VKSWSKKNVYWPRDLLGPDVPNVRILTFGYTAKAATMVEAVSQNNIHDHAKALVSDLRRQRKQEEEVTLMVYKSLEWEHMLTDRLDNSTDNFHGAQPGGYCSQRCS